MNKIPLYGLLIAVGSAIYVFESFIPFPIPIPGARWGFSNMVIVYALPFTSLPWLLALVLGKAIVGGLISGRFLGPTFLMGLLGSVSSVLLMYTSLKTFKKSGLILHSVIGALSNNVVQVLIGAQIVSSWVIIGYLPYMEILATLSGSANAVIAGILLRRVSKGART